MGSKVDKRNTDYLVYVHLVFDTSFLTTNSKGVNFTQELMELSKQYGILPEGVSLMDIDTEFKDISTWLQVELHFREIPTQAKVNESVSALEKFLTGEIDVQQTL